MPTRVPRSLSASRLPFALALALCTTSATAQLTIKPAPAAPTQTIAPIRVTVPSPAVVSDNVRESIPTDFIRVAFIDPARLPIAKLTTLAGPRKRAFVTATVLFEPPLPLQAYPEYSGLGYSDSLELIAFRCRLPNAPAAEATLATWPNVFKLVQEDVPVTDTVCNAPLTDIGQQVACYARAYQDKPEATVPAALTDVFSYAAALFQPPNSMESVWLKNTYGIYPAFAGSGYSIKDSQDLDPAHPMAAQEVLVKSVSSEYLVKNLPLADLGCRCIAVPPYPGRASDPLDPNFIAQAGGDGVCTEVPKLQAVPKLNAAH
jgi:hypothetical protein